MVTLLGPASGLHRLPYYRPNQAFGALAEFEKNLIKDRTLAGLQAARKRGRVGGRPRSMSDEKLRAAKQLLGDGTPPRDVAKIIGVSVPTLYRCLPASRSAA
jgi:DNA invertase Pin-like site-specific DNA recombinase